MDPVSLRNVLWHPRWGTPALLYLPLGTNALESRVKDKSMKEAGALSQAGERRQGSLTLSLPEKDTLLVVSGVLVAEKSGE